MRKAQKQEILSLIDNLYQVQEGIKKALEQNNLILAQDMISGAQESAISLGEKIEKTEGEGHRTVTCIEEYCELLFRAFEEINKNNCNANRIYKTLRKQLIKIENSVKNDIPIKMEIVFFPYKASMWDSLESIYLAAEADPDCDAYCVPIPYFTLNPDRSFGEMHYEGNVRPDGTPIEYPENIRVTDWQAYDFEERKPDVIYIHNPYDDCNLVTSVHPRYYSSNLKKYTDCLVYVPYYATSGGMSEGQRMLPAYYYVDYIVIQSLEFRRYFDEGIPNKKFLPFGSPKFDRVIKKCQNPPKPPKEWMEKIKGRKVYFYNISISGMLADTKAFLKKMNYVFECFEGREEVSLLWRPHPLLEATFNSMRPQYRHVYDALKQMFLDKNLGILDMTPDITDSVALSDAYIGDAGTSITSLFGVAGKPIFILNNRMHSEPEEDSWRKEMIFEFNYLEWDRFAITQGNKLYVSEPLQYNYRYFCDLSDVAQGGQYSSIYDINGKWYACPMGAQNILIIGEMGIERRIELKERMISGAAFKSAWKYRNYLLLIPLSYPAVVRYDTETGKITYFDKFINIFVKTVNEQKIVGGTTIYEGILYIASPTDNRVYQLNIESGKEQIIALPVVSRCGCFVMTRYRDEIWLMPYSGNIIVRWNPITDKTKEYTELPNEFHCESPTYGINGPAFNIPAFYGDDLYLSPAHANMYLKLNMNTGSFTEWQLPIGKDEGSTVENATFFWKLSDAENPHFTLYSYSTHKLYNINLETKEYKEIPIIFDLDEVTRHESGFCNYSKSLRYACIENYFNSLKSFLDNDITGACFDKGKQLAAYQEIAANCDGSCGQKTHSFVKAQAGCIKETI